MSAGEAFADDLTADGQVSEAACTSQMRCVAR